MSQHHDLGTCASGKEERRKRERERGEKKTNKQKQQREGARREEKNKGIGSGEDRNNQQKPMTRRVPDVGPHAGWRGRAKQGAADAIQHSDGPLSVSAPAP